MAQESQRLDKGIEHIGVTRAAFAATIGNMLEFYDFITYSFFAIQIGHTFFPAQSEYGSLMLSLATFGAGFVTRPVGGIVQLRSWMVTDLALRHRSRDLDILSGTKML